MKVSINWLNQYFAEKLDPKDLVEKFNLMSQEVAGLEKLVDIDGLVIGHVKSVVKHPDADKLKVCMVDVGDEELQIICGAPNVDTNQKVIVAKSGVTLPGDFKIKKAKIRGIESNGMICSLAELGIQAFESNEFGIYVLGEDALPGEDALKYLNLDDYVLELDLTANRADLLSLRGVAYDTAAMLNLNPSFHEPQVIRETMENPVSIFTQTKNCQVYYGQLIDNITIKQSPYWLKSRLIASGIRPINNVVDITNYVMLEYGQPLHAFDYDKVNSDRILVRDAIDKEEIITLDGEKRRLIKGDIVITDGERPIALAGVMGGLNTEIDASSRRVLLESAVFNSTKIRKTALRLNLKSESSSRFEKGIDARKTLEALNYASELLVKYADAIIVGKPSFFNTINPKKKTIALSMEKLIKVTGLKFEEDDVENIFKRLRFDFKKKGNSFVVTIPSRRPMESYQDLIEEIVRIHGYNKIPLTIPVTPTQGGLNKKQKSKRVIRNFFMGKGFYETKTYSLVTEEMAKKYDKETLPTIKILNPLTKEREYLRHSIIPSLINVLIYNKARKIEDVFIFETANTYFENDEKEKLAFLLNGKSDYSLWQGLNKEIDFYHLKGIIEALLQQLKITNYSIQASFSQLPNLHPGISAELLVDEEVVGFFGRLHPEEEHRFGMKDVYVCELELKKLYENSEKQEMTYVEVSKYPPIERDLAIYVANEISAQKIIDVIKKTNKKLLNSVEIFDVYYDQNKENKKSIALRLEFLSYDRTLEAREVDEQISKIIVNLKKELNAELRS
ncbi:MAG TPA: phenylalanine--tRNA ligase subunit beta [Bacillota bacterium]|nr:phenylalanine--tRNA ligase subunit beta [Bacillota bacterium]